MATDVVERLRSKYTQKSDCIEAADEIERLRSLLEEAGVSSKKKKKKKTNINLHQRGQHYDFLIAFSIHQDMTSDEAAEYLEIPVEQLGWWNTTSDLKSAGYIEWTGAKRTSRRGGSGEVYKITESGLEAISEVNQNV